MFSIVTNITSAGESPRLVVQSVLNNLNFVRDLHFIYPHYIPDEEDNLYPGWKRDREKLQNAQIPYKFEARLNVENFSDDKNTILVEVPPNCDLRLGDFERLKTQAGSADYAQTHFGLGTRFQMEGFSVWYAYLVICMVIQWFINRFAYNNKLYYYTDVRARFVVCKGKTKFIPVEHTYLWTLWNPNVMQKQYENATVSANEFPTPFSFVRWVLSNHTALGFGLWILPFIPVWFFFSISPISIVLGYQSFIFTMSGISVYITEVGIAYLIAKTHSDMPWTFAYCLMFPLAWITFPFVLTFSKN
jgi:hypothetical protein